jgi:wyosine [tRNA(Phe)-imidazoG37] synthetase (radical SAM superfamily)
MYKYLFGPVPSRRLGISLGVDLVPHKTCSLDCIYCECGETINLTVERREYVPVEEVLQELDTYFSNNPDPDYITFSGSGEPTLNSGIGDVLEFIRQKKTRLSAAVLTNGTLLGQEEVRKALLRADLVMPSLDGASAPVLQAINRPHPSIDAESYINGLALFRSEFKGIFNLEVFIVPGYNDRYEELELLKKAIQKINPDLVQFNTLDRPGAAAGIHAATQGDLQKIVEFFKPLKTEIIAAAPKRRTVSSYRHDMESAILETILRRPCTVEDLATILGSHINEINKYLGMLEDSEKIESVRQDRGLFYQARNKLGR